MNSFRSGMNSFQIEIMENCGDKVRNEFIPDRNEFILVIFFHSATVNCARQKHQWMEKDRPHFFCGLLALPLLLVAAFKQH